MIDMHMAALMTQLCQRPGAECRRWPAPLGWNGWRAGAGAVLVIGLLALGMR